MSLRLAKDWYSVVIYPEAKMIDQVADLKTQLANRIGWYPSRNSIAHITVTAFTADQYEMAFYIKQIEKFCYTQKQQKVGFDQLSFSKFSQAAVLLPDESSKPYLKDLLRRLRKQLKTSYTIHGSSAHISIGRKLSSMQIDQAENLFGSINLRFHCDTVALRKFIETKGQFEVIKTFRFLENPLNNAQYLPF